MTETEQPAGPDASYGRHALSTRGYVIVGIVPILIAAALFGLVVWNYDDTDIQGESAPLLASSWRPGQPAGGEQVVGVLQADDEGCPVLASGDDTVAVAWPAGYSARVSPGGTLTVYDPDGGVVARVDQEIRATGELVDASSYVGKPCDPDTGQVAAIQSEVQVVG